MSNKRRVIKDLRINEANEIVITLQGKRNAICARILERNTTESGKGQSFLLDRLIHGEGEVYFVHHDREEAQRIELSGCFVTKMTATTQFETLFA